MIFFVWRWWLAVGLVTRANKPGQTPTAILFDWYPRHYAARAIDRKRGKRCIRQPGVHSPRHLAPYALHDRELIDANVQGRQVRLQRFKQRHGTTRVSENHPTGTVEHTALCVQQLPFIPALTKGRYFGVTQKSNTRLRQPGAHQLGWFEPGGLRVPDIGQARRAVHPALQGPGGIPVLSLPQ